MKELREIYNRVLTIEYGWLDQNYKKHYKLSENFEGLYMLQDASLCLDNKIGVCWDQVEVERELLKDIGITSESYMINYPDDIKKPTHTFLTFEYRGLYYWFEHAWEDYQGLHPYKAKEELFKTVGYIFVNDIVKNLLNKEIDIDNVKLYNYSKPKSKLSYQEFYNHCESGIDVSNYLK